MVAIERKTTEQTFSDSSFRLADLPMRVLNHVTTNEDLEVTSIDHRGILNSISFRKSVSPEQVLGEVREVIDLMSFIKTDEVSPVPFKIDQLKSLVELTHYLADNKKFDNDGNVTSFDPDEAVGQISQRYGYTREEALQNISGCKNFLSDFIVENSLPLAK